MNKIHEWVNTGLLLLIAVLMLGTIGNNSQSYGSPDGYFRMPNSNATFKTLTITGATTFSDALTATSAAFSGTLSAAATTISGILRTDAGVTRSYSLATTTSATTYTLTAADIGNYDTIRQTLSGGASTFTLPATSTITALVPTAGDRAETCWLPLTNTLTFAAGTGIDLMVATSTNNYGGSFDLTIPAGGVGCVQWFRQTDSDITAGLIEYNDAD
jgi:hypothetical protein